MKKIPSKKRTLANEIVDAIQLGQFRGGEWLRQIDLEKKFQAARFDVRAALDELVVRQSIQHIPNRGYRVPIHDLAVLKAIREVRVIIECATAPGIIASVNVAALSDLKASAREFTQAIAEGTPA